MSAGRRIIAKGVVAAVDAVPEDVLHVPAACAVSDYSTAAKIAEVAFPGTGDPSAAIRAPAIIVVAIVVVIAIVTATARDKVTGFLAAGCGIAKNAIRATDDGTVEKAGGGSTACAVDDFRRVGQAANTAFFRASPQLLGRGGGGE